MAQTERRRPRKTNKEITNYDRLSLSFKAIGGGIWDFDIETGKMFCNERWHEILGIDYNIKKIETISDFISYIFPEDIEKATRIDDDAISNLIENDERYDIEFRIVRSSGEVRWIRSVASIIYDAQNHRRAIGCITDITDFRSRTLQSALNGSQQLEFSNGSGDEATAPPISSNMPGETTDNLHPLTEKERECLLWVSVGKTAWETAEIIGRSRRTVEFHLNNAIVKLEASNKIHATAIAIRNGWL
ncbi:helix-turn-helix transcriptional regulator [Sphingobium sp. EM0848]|uniref:helix-turn-helix transcriptional regulator n=1 Tax=Sphingobium sp. EM0848 TaxID=2743473 RepID=UPI00159C8ED4|nr:helix-turn-helix transcriptional regulator [Sphingobium sp. EM0848]